jgi:hypothetical protein
VESTTRETLRFGGLTTEELRQKADTQLMGERGRQTPPALDAKSTK